MKNPMSTVLIALFLVFCTHAPFMDKSASADSQKTVAKTKTAQNIEDLQPQPGDVRVIDGVEYIYAKNIKYMNTPWEPMYVWIRKDQYSAGLFEGLRSAPAAPTKEQKEMEQRIAKLEEELKKREGAPRTALPAQPVAVPATQPVSMTPVAKVPMLSLPTPTPSYPSPKMKRRVLVLPMTGATDSKFEQFAERATNRLISALEHTGMVICLDPATVGYRGDATLAEAMKDINELHGIQAVVKGALFDSKISLTVYNAETGLILRQLGSDVALLTLEHGTGSEAERMKAMDLGIQPIADAIMRSILSVDWHGRIASTEQGRIFINAGRMSGLEKGDTLAVYAPGEQIIDAATRTPLGKLKGDYKGEIEVAELFGVDASWARPRKGEKFSPTDLVYMKR
jgi:hypothetical protein